MNTISNCYMEDKMNNDVQDIFEIKLSKNKKIVAYLSLFISGFAVSWVFYKLIILSFIFAFLSLFLIKFYKKMYIKKISEVIEDEFYDINLLLSAELETGTPINMAIKSIKNEITRSDIYNFKYMNIEISNWDKKMNMGIKLNKIIQDFAIRSKNNNIMDYANMIAICTKKGGSIRDVIKNTNSILNEKRTLKREIEVISAEKKLEQKIMNLMPLAVLIMLDKSAPEFISPLYTNILGRITMTILLFIFLLSYLWSSKIASLN